MTGLQLQQQARELWRSGKHEAAARMYREAAAKQSGFPAMVNLKCAADCDSKREFNGTPKSTV